MAAPSGARGSVESTLRIGGEQGTLTEYCPARPVHMIPYNHGRGRIDQVCERLIKKGDYLLMVDDESGGLFLCIKTEKGVNKQPILKRRADGRFVICGPKPHHAQGFQNVEELISYYQVYGLEIATETYDDGQTRRITLDSPVNAKDDTRPPSDRRRPFRQLKDLQHYHGDGLTKEEAEKLLEKEGDYLLRGKGRKRPGCILSVKGRDGFVHREIDRNLESGGYELPKDPTNADVECVTSVDEWVQFHALFQVPVDGILLVRPISKIVP